MDTQPTLQQLRLQTESDAKKAHDDAVRAGKMLADASLKLKKAEELIMAANLKMSNARKFESVLIQRQKKLDRAFVLLNRERQSIQARQYKADQHDLMIDQNIHDY